MNTDNAFGELTRLRKRAVAMSADTSQEVTFLVISPELSFLCFLPIDSDMHIYIRHQRAGFPMPGSTAGLHGHCYVYANSLWHNSFETVENWIVPGGQTFRPPPWLDSSARVNWVQRRLHMVYFSERLQGGNNFCPGKANAGFWQGTLETFCLQLSDEI